jgi:leader peptidase (prepilin peptidase)/N-methyltransferase
MLGGMVGSFLNVCIYRLPRGRSVVFPASHCPHCGHRIPWFQNIPLFSWLRLRGKCAFCQGSISFRYFLVELIAALLFLACWLAFGHTSALLALVYCLVIAGLIVATFIDFEHFIIPDVITLGGIAAGFVCSIAVPEMHRAASSVHALKSCFWGIAAGSGIIYVFLRLGKLMFGLQRFRFTSPSKVHFTETSLVLPGQEIPYEDIFYRKSDVITFEAGRLEMVDRCYGNASVRLTQTTLEIGGDVFKTEEVPCFEAVTSEILVPREAMGLGDVKFMGAIGAFIGWYGVLFSLTLSALIGSLVGLTLIALRKRAWSSRIPYGPYIAFATVLWIFARGWLETILFIPR